MSTDRKLAFAELLAAEEALPWHSSVADYALPHYSESVYGETPTFESLQEYLVEAQIYEKALSNAEKLRREYYDAYESPEAVEKIAVRIWRHSLEGFVRDAKSYLGKLAEVTQEGFAEYSDPYTNPELFSICGGGQIHSYIPNKVSDRTSFPLSKAEGKRRKNRRAVWRKRAKAIVPLQFPLTQSNDAPAAQTPFNTLLEKRGADLRDYRAASWVFAQNVTLAESKVSLSKTLATFFAQVSHPNDFQYIIYFALCRNADVAAAAWELLQKQDHPYVDMRVAPLWLWHRERLGLRVPVSEKLLYIADIGDKCQMAVSSIVMSDLEWQSQIQVFLEQRIAVFRELIEKELRALQKEKGVDKIYKKARESLFDNRFLQMQRIMNLWGLGSELPAIAANQSKSLFLSMLDKQRTGNWASRAGEEKEMHVGDKEVERYKSIAKHVVASMNDNQPAIGKNGDINSWLVVLGAHTRVYGVKTSNIPSGTVAVISARNLNENVKTALEVFESPLAVLFQQSDL